MSSRSYLNIENSDAYLFNLELANSLTDTKHTGRDINKYNAYSGFASLNPRTINIAAIIKIYIDNTIGKYINDSFLAIFFI